jgi:phosphoribosylformimino-5-aminoimidazole carboxamide ribotide isomerase
MIVIPAIDLRGGRAVRLVRGNPAEETEYSADPVEVASGSRRRARRRCTWSTWTPRSSRVEHRRREGICHAVAIPVQVGGGIRSLESIGAMLEPGAARRSWDRGRGLGRGVRRPRVEEFAEHVVVSLDVRGGHLMTRAGRGRPGLEDVLPALNETGAARTW